MLDAPSDPLTLALRRTRQEKAAGPLERYYAPKIMMSTILRQGAMCGVSVVGATACLAGFLQVDIDNIFPRAVSAAPILHSAGGVEKRLGGAVEKLRGPVMPVHDVE